MPTKIFPSQLDRQQDSLAKLIPDKIWEEYFNNNTLTELEQQFLALSNRGGSAQEIVSLLENTNTEPSLKARAAVAILSALPTNSNLLNELMVTSLREVIQAIVLKPYVWNILIQHLDKQTLCELIPEDIRQTEILKMIQADNYYAFRNAAANGQLEVINRLCGLILENNRQDEILKMIYPTPMSFRFSPNEKVSFPPALS